MSKYDVHGTRTIQYEVTVEANSQGEANYLGYQAITFGARPRSVLDFWEDPGTLNLVERLRPPPLPGGLSTDTGPEGDV